MITKRKPASVGGLAFGFLLLAGLFLAPQAGAAAQTGDVAEFVEVEGFIDPVTERFLISMVDRAESERSALLIIRLDTPGGVGISLERLIGRIVQSKVPIVVWIAPAGGGAGSTGAFIAASAHVLAMSHGSTLGPAEDPTLDARGDAKSDALLHSFSNLGRRSPALTEQLTQKSFDSEAAVSLDSSIVIADTTAALISEIKGKQLDLVGAKVTVPQTLNLRFHKMGLLDQLLHSAARPPIAYLLILFGLFGLIFELYNPGIGGAGFVGSVSLGFGVYALSVLPASWAGAGILALGLALYVRDLHVGSLGWPSVVGSLAFVGGSILLFPDRHDFRLAWWMVAAGVAATVLFFISVMTAAIKARTAKPIAGAEGIVGMPGTARTDIAPEGQVLAKGTLWRARTVGVAIPEGAEVEILGVSGLVLMVEMKKEQT